MHAQQPVEIKTFQSKNNKVGAGWGWQRRLFSLQLEKGTKHRPIATACSSRVVPLSAGWAGVSQIAQVEQWVGYITEQGNILSATLVLEAGKHGQD